MTTEGIRPDLEKVQGIMEFPAPRNIKHLREFLGLVNFYSKFSSKHAAETVPLLHLIKKGVPWKWDEGMQKSFDRVKQLFSETITLYFPDPSRTYYLETDASNYALGAILYQKNDKQEKKLSHWPVEHSKDQNCHTLPRKSYWQSCGHYKNFKHIYKEPT